jgi:hypothetical protein
MVSRGAIPATAAATADLWLNVDAPPNSPVCAFSAAHAYPKLALSTIHVWMLPWSAAVPSGLLHRIVGPTTVDDTEMTTLLTRHAAATTAVYDHEEVDADEEDWMRRQHVLRLALLAVHTHSRAYPWSSAPSTDIPPDAYHLFQTLAVFARTATDARDGAAAQDEADNTVARAAIPWQALHHSLAGKTTTFLADLPGAAHMLLMLPTAVLRRFARSAVDSLRYHPETAPRRQRVAMLLRLILGNDGAAPDRVAGAVLALAQAVSQSVAHDAERYSNVMEEACNDLFSRPGSTLLVDHTLDAAAVDVLIEFVHRPLLLNRNFVLGTLAGFRAPADAADSPAGGPLSSASGVAGAIRLLAILNESLRTGDLTAAMLARADGLGETLATFPTVARGLEGADAAAYRTAVETLQASLATLEDAAARRRRRGAHRSATSGRLKSTSTPRRTT